MHLGHLTQFDLECHTNLTLTVLKHGRCMVDAFLDEAMVRDTRASAGGAVTLLNWSEREFFRSRPRTQRTTTTPKTPPPKRPTALTSKGSLLGLSLPNIDKKTRKKADQKRPRTSSCLKRKPPAPTPNTSHPHPAPTCRVSSLERGKLQQLQGQQKPLQRPQEAWNPARTPSSMKPCLKTED